MIETLATMPSRNCVPQNRDLAAAAKQGDESFDYNIRAINPAYEEFVDLATLLTTQVENLLQAQDFPAVRPSFRNGY